MSVTFHYFDGYGRGETIRMILQGSGVEFTDDRLTYETFGAFAATGVAEFGNVPCLEIDGKVLVESRAIERYLLARAGTTTATPHEGYLNDSIISFLDDTKQIMAKFIYVDKDLPGLMEWMKTDLPWYLTRLNARVNEHNYFVGDRPQHADWAIFEFIYDVFLRAKYVDQNKPLLEAHAPKLLTFAENFKNSNERLNAYLATRPECEF